MAFHAYDIRGIVGKEIDENFARRLGEAFSVYLGKRSRLAVAMDVRNQSDELSRALISSLVRSGNKVERLGIVPTPLFYFAIAHRRLDGGIMVTASHNPPEYNGFKLCREGAYIVAAGMGMERLKSIFDSGTEMPSAKAGGSAVDVNVEEEYLRYIAERVSPLGGMKVVLDVGNGATYRVARRALEVVGAQVTTINDTPDGSFPSRPPEPKDESIGALKRSVIESGAALGVAFDGDGDRALFVDELGKTLSGDVALALIGRYYLERNNWAGRIVTEVNISSATQSYMASLGGEVIESRVGHAYIMDTMIKEGALLGGEISGHYYFSDVYGLDDALFAAIVMAEAIKHYGRPLSSLAADIPTLPSSPVLEIDVPSELKAQIMENIGNKLALDAKKVSKIDGIKAYFDDGWVLIRMSNTMPQLKIRAEGSGNKRLVKLATEMVREAMDSIQLPK
ncbi:MAG: phosphomannomutase/phosphoglucomutase [Nitrososphaerota archaeon]|jgi:phosphomannomutase|nr:phosphomannomutase/phosphoglucomutase [Nitrososphaerota archaeon]MDG7036503.1 phosphomannomutase/phosphoglucomutase [Nitrososphaerota archaeon]MDG7039242.1 phosphomannomutase/phosphoglucomutase [Nitrososphaerota archaeon]MDG7043622.1 phosphomannomutase/phosphoglucomutase [Nitrososphaerota archaeon]